MKPIINKSEFYITLDSIKSNNEVNLKNSIDLIMRASAKNGRILYSTAPSLKECVIELLEKSFNDEAGTLRWFIFDMDFGRKHKETSDFMSVSDELYAMLLK